MLRSAALEAPAEVGEVVGAYRLESVLGRGGMGCVYAASHVRLPRRAAVKVLAEKYSADRSAVSRFFHEARIVNDVRHPNIVDIIDFIETSEPRRVACVMELIEGPSLGKLLRSRRLSVAEAASVGLQLASALEAVHAIGVVHRDLKPDNVLVMGHGDLLAPPSVKVLDFGIAKVHPAVAAEHRTATGALLGTPAYMAPEQVSSEPVSAATDIYALGEVFYEMVTGKRLFAGDVATILKVKLLAETPEVAVEAGTPCASLIQALVRACVAPKPWARPSISDVRAALEEIQARADERSGATPSAVAAFAPLAPTLDERLDGSASRSKVLVALGGLCLVLAAAIAFGLSRWEDRRREVPEVAAPTAAPVPVAEPEPPPAEPPPAEPPPAEKVEKVEKPAPKKKLQLHEPKPIKRRQLPSW